MHECAMNDIRDPHHILLSLAFLPTVDTLCAMLPLQEKMTAKLQFFREEQDAWEQSRK